MPRILPFDVAVSSLRQLVEGMIPGDELALTVQGEPKAIVTGQCRRVGRVNRARPPTSTPRLKILRSTWIDAVVGHPHLSVVLVGRPAQSYHI